jgi:hypothetical protein
MARAGHPLPAAARPGHNATFLDLPPGLPLGVGGGQYQSVRVRLPRGSTLVLYTDGLIESRVTDISTGMARLADTLTRTSRLGPGEVCDSLLATLAPEPADDIAILMARTRQTGTRFPSTPGSKARAERGITEPLSDTAQAMARGNELGASALKCAR